MQLSVRELLYKDLEGNMTSETWGEEEDDDDDDNDDHDDGAR